MKQKWYEKDSGVITLLILFFPIGLYLMWKKTNWNKKIKGAISFFVLITLIYSRVSTNYIDNQVAGNNNNNKTVQTGNINLAKSETPKSETKNTSTINPNDTSKKEIASTSSTNSTNTSSSNSSDNNKNSSFSSNTSSNSSGSSSSSQKDVTTYEPAKGDRIVYWTPGGKSYHYNKNCRSLARSKTILEGAASTCPKTDPCNNCVR
ncbi:hypothetical protein [Inconstantimicrobium mannanitabidum]|uniref:Uncharacterized protein n=1 Tax=Inconstantimicrobium mannanitabidum TaxID=1604901 RepID=A0ACB5RB07_9CLOT|nr:hypothetical protein [Clostridium sp. TW13]GKX66193.1 hypothetical protein rsdtw13_14510 [Clostridium sp. TW13]